MLAELSQSRTRLLKETELHTWIQLYSGVVMYFCDVTKNVFYSKPIVALINGFNGHDAKDGILGRLVASHIRKYDIYIFIPVTYDILHIGMKRMDRKRRANESSALRSEMI